MRSFALTALMVMSGAALAQSSAPKLPDPPGSEESTTKESPSQPAPTPQQSSPAETTPGASPSTPQPSSPQQPPDAGSAPAADQPSGSAAPQGSQPSSSPQGSGAQAPSGAYGEPMDMTKVGPLSRKVTTPDRAGINALVRAIDQAWKSGDVQAVAELHDFPLHMSTDDSQGEFSSEDWTREQFVQMMGDMMARMPRDMTVKHKLNPQFLSDTLAVIVDEPTLMRGGTKLGTFKSVAVVVKKNGRWLYKEGVEAGWGDMAKQQEAGAAKP